MRRAGFSLGGARVPAGQDQVRLTLTVPPITPKEPLSLFMEGRGADRGREVVRPVVPAEDMMQAFAYHHLVPVQRVEGVRVRAGDDEYHGESPQRDPRQNPCRRHRHGAPGRARRARSSRRCTSSWTSRRRASPSSSESPGSEGTEIVLQSDGAKVKPGLKGNLIVNAFAVEDPADEQGETGTHVTPHPARHAAGHPLRNRRTGTLKHRSRNKWRKLPACGGAIYRKLEAYATEESDSYFSNGAKVWPGSELRTWCWTA